MGFSNTLPVKVWISSEECEIGDLEFRLDDVIVSLHSGKILSGSRSDKTIFYEIETVVSLDEKGQSVAKPLNTRYRVLLKPNQIIQHPYTDKGVQFLEDIFPPSTAGFYGRLQAGKENALYTIQGIKGSEQFLLFISNPLTGQIYEMNVIQPYEAESLSMVEDYRIRQALFMEAAKNRAKSMDDILGILDKPAPSWPKLTKLLRDVSVPNLKLGKTMRDTLTELVPSTFPEPIRNELMAFLAYVIEGKIPKEDPLTYSYQFSSTTVLETLLLGHLMHLIDGTDWPSYVKLMTLAERGQLDFPKRAVSDSIKDYPWLLFSQKCAEHFPNWQQIVINTAQTLNNTNKVVLSLPTTRTNAKRTRKAWKQRFAEMMHGLRVYGHISPSSLGLAELIYLGAAYRWSHRHMKFIARLGSIGENTPHMQVMLVPISVVEQIKRALPSITHVAWSARASNLNLYDARLGKWNILPEKLVDSLEKRESIRNLRKQYGGNPASEIYHLTTEEVKVIDLVAEGVELSFLEIPEFLSNWGCSERKGRQLISNLTKRNIMKLTYEVSDRSLVSISIIAHGRSEKVYSLVSSFMKNTPTAYARLDDTGENAIILSRLPEESVYTIASQLTSKGIEHDVNIRCMRPTTFRRYTSNLYQRLLKDDGTWDDDVSAFLSQARSKKKELSESNA
jgi:hypothetical protein